MSANMRSGRLGMPQTGLRMVEGQFAAIRMLDSLWNDRMHCTLNNLERIHDLMVIATLSDDAPDPTVILALRQRFAVEFDSLIKSLGDEAVQRHSPIVTELRDKARTCRVRVMTYTFYWQPRVILSEPEAYREAAEAMAGQILNLIVHVRKRLDQIGILDSPKSCQERGGDSSRNRAKGCG